MNNCPKCKKPGAHFAPPSFGESGFYICEGEVMEEKVSDLDIILHWGRTGEHLKAHTSEGTLLFSSVTGEFSPLLSDRQVKWILEDYNRKRKKFVF